jgi:hypothetical protein
MIAHDLRWSLPRGNTPVPSRWQATLAYPAPYHEVGIAPCPGCTARLILVVWARIFDRLSDLRTVVSRGWLRGGEVLAGEAAEDKSLVDSRTNTRSPPDGSALLREGAGHHHDRVFGPHGTEVTDRMLIFGARHLRTILADYETQYSGRRPHRSRQLHPPRPATPSLISPRSGSNAGPSLAASSTNTSERAA